MIGSLAGGSHNALSLVHLLQRLLCIFERDILERRMCNNTFQVRRFLLVCKLRRFHLFTIFVVQLLIEVEIFRRTELLLGIREIGRFAGQFHAEPIVIDAQNTTVQGQPYFHSILGTVYFFIADVLGMYEAFEAI